MYCTHDCAVCQRWEGTSEEWQKFSALQRSEWKAQKPNQVALMHDIAGAWEALKIDECALRRHAQQKAGRSRSRQILLPLPRQILLPIPRGALPRQRHVPAPLPCGGATPPRHSLRKGAGHTKNGWCPVLTKFSPRPAKGKCKQQIKPTAGVKHIRPAWQVTAFGPLRISGWVVCALQCNQQCCSAHLPKEMPMALLCSLSSLSLSFPLPPFPLPPSPLPLCLPFLYLFFYHPTGHNSMTWPPQQTTKSWNCARWGNLTSYLVTVLVTRHPIWSPCW